MVISQRVIDETGQILVGGALFVCVDSAWNDPTVGFYSLLKHGNLQLSVKIHKLVFNTVCTYNTNTQYNTCST